MGRELAQPDWLPLTDDELLAILGRSDPGGLGRQPAVTWRSPRPMSAAALVRHGDATVFVKRHHVSVRTPEQLAAEHEFATHLRTRGLPVPAVVRLAGGHGGQGMQSVLRRGDFCYEVHQAAGGIDLYRDGQLVAVRQPGTRVRGGRGPAPLSQRLLCPFTGRRRDGRPARARRRSAAPG